MQPRYLVFDEVTSMLDPRMQRLVIELAGKLKRDYGKTIVWVDREPKNNEHGTKRLRDEIGATVVPVLAPEGLNEQEHAHAELIITYYGYDDRKAALRVLDAVNQWGERPPVVVFSSPGDFAPKNRRAALRRGAYDLATQWSELFRIIEELFGREVGV